LLVGLVAAWLILRPSDEPSRPGSGLEPSEVSSTDAPDPAEDEPVATDTSRVPVPAEPLPSEVAAVAESESQNAGAEVSEVAPAAEPTVVHFPYGQPTPDWVFEQKYAGMSESSFALAKVEVAAAYSLASKKAFLQCWETGDFEVVPAGQSKPSPGNVIVGGRSIPGSTDSQVARLDVEKFPEVYELCYEHLWISTTGWKP
jgi:hypothetical protein